jgi:capsular polysaccharide biosynthesis protein
MEEKEIDLRQILKTLLKRKHLIIILTIIFLSFGFVYSVYSFISSKFISPVKPIYQSYTTLILSKINSDGSMDIYNVIGNNSEEAINLNDITDNYNAEAINLYDTLLNEKLIKTYSEIIRSNKVLNEVISHLGLTRDDLSLKDTDKETLIDALSDSINVAPIGGTEIIKITVSNEDPNLAEKIANDIPTFFGTELNRIYNVQNVYVIDPAVISENPSNVDDLNVNYINYIKYIIMFALAGLVVSMMIVMLLFYLDNTIKSSDEIESYLGLKTLSVIPQYEPILDN